jgi:hypothetical protein
MGKSTSKKVVKMFRHVVYAAYSFGAKGRGEIVSRHKTMKAAQAAAKKSDKLSVTEYEAGDDIGKSIYRAGRR